MQNKEVAMAPQCIVSHRFGWFKMPLFRAANHYVCRYDPSDVAQLHEVSQQSLAEKEHFGFRGHAYKMHFKCSSNAVVST
ncbi:MAG: hypothetical protein IPN94_21025 [Sphingobacteriales bacterium]|nr:hypothetical protein [Sphingobacteriales bacterium]